MPIIDLRSDTVTVPTSEMRKAMYEANVGDDVYREDPTVIALEELGAQMTGKEAGLYVTSGTMGNQIAAMTHTNKGDEVICEAQSHIFYYEVGGLACLSGAQARTIEGERGILSAEAICDAIRPRGDVHVPTTSLIWLENTHNRAGGTYYTEQQLAAIRQVADGHGIAIHMDGARVFNAAAAQGLKVDKLTKYADSVMFCLSKGLCAPVGSLLVGAKDFIERARKYRKMLGGGMRQAGFIAAAGIVALKQMVERLPEDHFHARMLGEAIAELGLAIDLETVKTNIVIFDVAPFNTTAERFVALLNERGIKASSFGRYKVRMVTHYGITRDDISYTIKVLSELKKVCC